MALSLVCDQQKNIGDSMYLLILWTGVPHLMLWRRQFPKYFLAEVEGVAAKEVDITISHVLLVLHHCTQ